MYINQNYYDAIAAGTRPVLSGALGIYSITEDDIMEGSFQIDEEMESLPIGGIVTSCLTLVLNNFEGKFDPSLLTTSIVMSLTMTVGTDTLTLPDYHIVDKKVADNTIMLTLMDMTDTLATPPSINSPIAGATWADVVDDILDRFSMTFDTDTAAATKLAGAASVPVIYGQDTYKSVLLHILQYLNLFARISSGSELYIFYPDPEATPIPVTDDMIASIDAEGPHTPTAVSIKAFNGEEYVTSGTSGYTATLEGCPLIVGTPDPSGYLTEVSDLTFYNFNLDCIGDPSVQIGDYIEIGGTKLCLVGTKSYKYGGYANLSFKWDIDTVDDFSYAVNTEVDPAVAEQVDDARKVATNYLSADTSGIMVADLADGAQVPSSATGRNVFIDSSAVHIRDGVTDLASFGSTVVIGDQSASGNYAVIDNDSFDIYHGNTEMTHFGYGEGNAINGTSNAPYFSIGSRKTTTTPYNSSSTYGVGDLCVYNDKLYVCNTDITTPEAWDSSHWMLIIGNFSVVEGRNTTASGDSAHAEGIGSIAINHYAHAEGYQTTASGLYSHAEGYQAIASKASAHAEGYQTTASGVYSHAEGYQAIASKVAAHVEGYQTTASGNYGSHAEGEQTVASGNYGSHAEGQNTTASGDSAHAEGFHTTASGLYSHAGGNNTTARTKSQTVIGEYNILDTAGSAINKGDYALIIGNGTYDSARSNALTVDWNGNTKLSGGIYGTDSSSTDYAMLNYDGSNLMLGARTGASHHHTGRTYISAGYDATNSKGYTTAYIQIPNTANTGVAKTSGIWHDSNLAPTSGTWTPSAAVSCATGTDVTLGTFTVPAGVWTIHAKARFSTNANGVRRVWLQYTSGTNVGTIADTYAPAISGYNTDVLVTFPTKLTEQTTFRLMAIQTSGSSLNATPRAAWSGFTI